MSLFLGHRQIGLHLGGKGEHINKHHLGEVFELSRLLDRRLIDLMKGTVSFQANLVRPCLEIFSNEARICKFINAFRKIPGFYCIAVLLRCHIDSASKHCDSRRCSPIFQAFGAFNKCLRGSGRHIFWATRSQFYREYTNIFCNWPSVYGPGSAFRIISACKTRGSYRSGTEWTGTKHIKQGAVVSANLGKNDCERCATCAAMRTIMKKSGHGQ